MDALARLNRTLAGRYAVEREIGRGGMATVFLARDLKHNRKVALKMLNPELGAVLGVERFLSEIQVTATLQHPNLLPLFDSGEAEGLLYYVMPYVAGESLGARLAREKQLPIDEATYIAAAVASALDYAHRHGVVHRDLKPENILLHERQPLVADFGIALAVRNAGGQRITQTGLSLGTPQYMSPEQATGDRTIDGRTDIYALGAVLYEMLTGDPPHVASSAQAIIARMLTDTPRPVSAARPNVSPHVDHAIACALEKLPADRWQTAREFAVALAGPPGVVLPSGVRTPGTFDTPDARPSWRRLLTRRAPMAAVAFVAGIAIASVAAKRYASAEERESVTFVLDPPSRGDERAAIENFSISPDGRTIAFVAASDSGTKLYLRRLGSLDAHIIPGTDGAQYAAFSPDGKWLAVGTSDGRVLRVALDGRSAPIMVAEHVDPYGEAFWTGDQIVLGQASPKGVGLVGVPAAGGVVRPVFKAKPEWAHGVPLVAPDGKTVLFTDWGPGYTEDDYLAIGSLETGEHERTPLRANRALGIVDGRVVYLRAGAILAAPVDLAQRRITGDAVRVMEGLSFFEPKGAVLSPNGTLVYRRGDATGRLALLDSAGQLLPMSTDAQIMTFFTPPRFAPDGRRVALIIGSQRADTLSSDVAIFDVGSRTFTQLSSTGNVMSVAWTPDGKYIVYTSGAPWMRTTAGVWRQLADGTQPAERLVDIPGGAFVVGVSVTPDGRGVLYCRGDGSAVGGHAQLYYMSFVHRKPERIVDEDFTLRCDAKVSPDGRWMAYVANEGARTAVYVRPFRRPGMRVLMSEGFAGYPIWSRDGSRLYYARRDAAFGRASVVAVRLSTRGDGLAVLGRDRAWTLPAGWMYDLAPDGKRLLTLQRVDSRVQVVVTTNWLPQLRAQLAGTR